MKRTNKLLAFALVLALLFSFTGSAFAAVGDSHHIGEQNIIRAMQKAMQEASAFMLNPVGDYYPDGGLTYGTMQGEWAAFALGRSELAVPRSVWKTYAQNATADIVEEIQKVRARNPEITSLAIPHYRKRTENMRILIGFNSVNLNPANIGGYNLIRPLGNYTDIIWQGINSTIFALISLDTADYAMPILTEDELTQGVHGAAVQASREMLVQRIMSQELPSGGWVLDTGFEVEDGGGGSEVPWDRNTADPDITGMAIQALAPYRDMVVTVGSRQVRVGDSIQKALDVMGARQQLDGDFSTMGYDNVESTAQILMALLAMGIDPLKDPRFITDTGNTLINGILKYHVSGSGFRHVMAGSVNAMATDQAMYALVAYDRFLKGKPYSYDMSDRAEPHAIAAQAAEHGAVSFTDSSGNPITSAAQGSRVNIVASPSSLYSLKDVKVYLQQNNLYFDGDILRSRWETTPTAETLTGSLGTGFSFDMPNVPVTVVAEFAPGGPVEEPRYGFIQASANGTVRVSVPDAKAGETIIVNPKANERYEYVAGTLSARGETSGELTLTAVESGGWQFTMPAEDVTLTASFAELEKIGRVAISLEKFILGNGYMIEPQMADIYRNDNVAKVLDRLLREKGLDYTCTGSVESAFYLASVQDEGAPQIDPPGFVLDAIGEGGLVGNNDDHLGEFDYYSDSGWMYSVNNAFPNYGASDFDTVNTQIPLKDGDVVRWQFTLYGYGTDIGGGFEGDASEGSFEGSLVPIANRTRATLALAQAKSDYPQWVSDNRQSYETACAVAGDLTATDAQLEATLSPVYAMLAAAKDEFYIIKPNNAMAPGNDHTIAAPAKASPLEDVVVTVTPKAGYRLVAGSLKANATALTVLDAQADTYRFTMPYADVALTARFETAPQVVYGDVNGDGRINSTDAMLVLQYRAGLLTLTASQILAGDVNGDGRINSTDAMLVLQYRAGAITKFPVQQ